MIALYTIYLAELKGLINHCLIIGNLVHTYIAGLIAAVNLFSRSSRSNGLIISAVFVYNLVFSAQLFLVLLSALEFISAGFRTLTLPNRLSVNIFAGSMIISVLSINSFNLQITAL